MSVRETAHHRIDELTEEQLTHVLRFLDSIMGGQTAGPGDGEHASLRSLIGIGRSAEPTDVAQQKDDYLAEAYAASER